MSKSVIVGLAGNPNCGKTTLFNALTGSHQKVGNYAGVTIEKKEGRREHNGVELRIFDLPGTYSLTAYSMDEMVARDFLLNDRPDVIVDVLDATNLQRNLYLTTQFMEMGVPIVGVLNIADQADARGILIDEARLSGLFGFPVIKTVGTKGSGIEGLMDAVLEVAKLGRRPKPISYGAELQAELDKLVEVLRKDDSFCDKYPAPWIALKLMEKDSGARAAIAGEMDEGHKDKAAVLAQADKGIAWIEQHFGRDAEIVVSEQRYAFIHGAYAEAVSHKAGVKDGDVKTAGLDSILMNRLLGLPIFLVIIWAMFQVTFTLGSYPAAWLESFFSWLGGAVSSLLPAGSMISSLIVDGIIGGVGGVFSFVPLVIILFLLISFLEDLGYMSRAAFIMDRFLHLFGLHGQSFLPMMLGFGCTVPAIMAARTLKSPKDRILTVMVIPFMSCGAKMPVHVLLAAAFFPENAGSVVMLIYAIGVIVALVSAKVLRATALRGESSPFVMELPPYRLPTARGIAWHVVDKTWMYVKRAGTVILAASVLIWFATSFPQATTAKAPNATDAGLAGSIKGAAQGPKQLESSFAGIFGKAIEPAIAPLGFDWKIGVAMVTGFAAKEVIVSTMGVMYKLEGSAGPTTVVASAPGAALGSNYRPNVAGTDIQPKKESASLREALRADPGFNPLVAFNLMLFVLLVTPCFASLATIRAELGTRWLLFSIAFTLSIAWILCFGVYQIGGLFGLAARLS